jgi:hypothetical protein
MDKRTQRFLAGVLKRIAARQARRSPDRLRRDWIDHWKRVDKKRRKWARFEMVGPYWPQPLPAYLRGLACGAKTRSGAPCECRVISMRNGRCWAHGGASTGPTSLEGKATAAANGGLVRMWPERKRTPNSA